MRERKDFCANNLTDFSINIDRIGTLFRLTSVIDLILISFHRLIFKGENPILI